MCTWHERDFMSAELQQPQLIDIPAVPNSMGDLFSVEAGKVAPFEVRRVYWVCGIPAHASRGRHAHKDNQEIDIALHGAFTVEVKDQQGNQSRFRLDSPRKGLFVDSLYWRELFDYDEESICLVLASNHYDEEEYIRDFSEFLSYSPLGPPEALSGSEGVESMSAGGCNTVPFLDLGRETDALRDQLDGAWRRVLTGHSSRTGAGSIRGGVRRILRGVSRRGRRQWARCVGAHSQRQRNWPW